MYVMQEQIDACNAIMIFEIHEWSFKSFSLIKSWVQNWVSIDIFVKLKYSIYVQLIILQIYLLDRTYYDFGYLFSCQLNPHFPLQF